MERPFHNQHSKDSKSPICPLSKLHCGESFTSLQELQFHLEDVHCVDFRSTLKRSRSAGEERPGPTKRTCVSRRRLSRQKTEDLTYEFVDESNTIWNQGKRSTSRPTLLKAPSSASSGSSPISEIMSDQNESNDDTPPSSWCAESKNGFDNEGALGDGADDEDWEHIGKIDHPSREQLPTESDR